MAFSHLTSAILFGEVFYAKVQRAVLSQGFVNILIQLAISLFVI